MLVLILVVFLLGAAAIVAVAAPPTKTPPPTILTAVVNVDGTLARGKGALSSRQVGADGGYEISFNTDVSQCTYTASGGEARSDTPGPDDAVVFTVAPRAGAVNAVYVLEWDGILGYDSYSSGFHLIVVC